MLQEGRNRKSRCWQDSFLLEALRESLFHARLLVSAGCQKSWALLGLQLHGSDSCHSNAFFSVCPLFFLQEHRSLKLGLTLVQPDLILTNYISKDLISKQGHIPHSKVPGEQEFWEVTILLLLCTLDSSSELNKPQTVSILWSGFLITTGAVYSP